VIIAVPAVMWTITTFVRTYVAPPKVPTFERMTLSPSQDSAATAPQTAPAPAAEQAQASTPQTQAADASAITTVGNQLQSADANAPAAAPQVATAAALAPTGPSGARPASGDRTDRVAAPAASASSFAWPNPPTASTANTGANTGAATGPTLAEQEPPTSSAAEELPAAAPLAGRIPLPRRRPNVFVMAAMAPTGVPLPRARPADAPNAAASTISDAPYPGYEPGLQH